MHQKILELLTRFRDRASDPALQGRMCYTQEVFRLAYNELQVACLEADRDTEPPNLIASVPPACVALVHEALHFNPHQEDDWESLGHAALAIQSGLS